jgi:hypothetical protein
VEVVVVEPSPPRARPVLLPLWSRLFRRLAKAVLVLGLTTGEVTVVFGVVVVLAVLTGLTCADTETVLAFGGMVWLFERATTLGLMVCGVCGVRTVEPGVANATDAPLSVLAVELTLTTDTVGLTLSGVTPGADNWNRC